jgi:hypothetical protein
MFILAKGIDPMSILTDFAIKKKVENNFKIMSLG